MNSLPKPSTPTVPTQSATASLTRRSLAALSCILFLTTASGQPVATPWGNVAGIQVSGETLPFETSLRAVNADWSGYVSSSKYNWEGLPEYKREGKTYTCTHFLEQTALHYTTKITDLGDGATQVDLSTSLDADLPMAGAFFAVNLPAADYAGARIEFIGSDAQPLQALTSTNGGLKELARTKAKGFRVISAKRRLEVLGDVSTDVIVRQDLISQPDYLNDPLPRVSFVAKDPKINVTDFQIYLAVLPGDARKGASSLTHYKLQASGEIDRAPVQVTLEANRPGRRFDGVGGNFRMQYPELDAQVVDYCFEHLNVTWGRIAFPWAEWQPDENADEEAKAAAGGLSRSFYAQIEMARTLAQRRIPMILSVWVPPTWAVDHHRKIAKGVKLDEAKLQKCADSIANYLVYLKNHYGIEPVLFSFNETDYGVEVHQSSEEHARANKVIGATFAARGLVTKMLLGDTGAGTTKSHELVRASEADKTLAPYLGAISFHNYHGVTDEDLKVWGDSSRATNLPLLADEGGPDSAAHRYPLIWVTPWFAQLEVDQYVRIGNACQPISILPWQLNADYSLLAGGGTYGDNSPLRPTQRFWNLKQLGTLSGAFWLPVHSSAATVHVAALGDIARGAYAIHLTNNGATRDVTLTGLPPAAKKFRIYVTDAQRGMQVLSVRSPVDGKLTFPLEAQAFTSLISE